jgi:short-subunit dehydrogenase
VTPSRPTALVTGASAGIGAAFARALAARGQDLILTARRADRMEALAVELRERHGATVTILPADLAQPGAVEGLVDAIAARGLRVDWLINNAGYGVSGALEANPWEVHAAFLRVMVDAPAELIHRLLPAMRTRGYGRIVNVASLAGLVPAAAGNTMYPASKAFLIKFTEALALENAEAGINITALCPGFTWSEFHDVTGTRAMMDKLPGWMWQTAEAVVAEGIDAVEAGHVIHVPGGVNRAIRRVVGWMPERLALAISAKQGKRYRNADH